MIIRFDGSIGQDAGDALVAATEALKQAEKTIGQRLTTLRLYLASRGGSVDAAMRLGRYLSKSPIDIATIVPRGASCASSCVLLLAAGKRRAVHGDLIIHRIAFLPETDQPIPADQYRQVYQNQVAQLRNYLDDMGIRSELADDMMRIPSDEQKTLTASEATRYGFNEVNPHVAEQQKANLVRQCGMAWYKAWNAGMHRAYEVCAAQSADTSRTWLCVDREMAPITDQCPALHSANAP